MNRRDFLKQSASALGALATISMLEIPLMAYGMVILIHDGNPYDFIQL